MLWLGGFTALEITTSTPDALCPPIEEARAAVKARVGEVQGSYHVEFAVVRGVDGQRRLELVVHEGQRPVLERTLPLQGAGCQDAAQAIALVLERYFDALEKPDAPGSSGPELEPIPDRPSDQPERPAARPAASDPTRAPIAATVEGPWRVRAGLLYDLELGIAPSLGGALFPAALRTRSGFQLGVALDVAPFVARLTESARGQEIKAFTLQTALSMPLGWRFPAWSAALGPWAQLRLQRAEAAGLSHQQPAYRFVPGVGAAAELAWSLAPSWALGWAVAGGAQAAGTAARFVLRRAEAAPKPVLIPERWFGQSQLTLALSL
jgi:hypothetical protein